LTEDGRYELPPGVRARREKFGLLFYNSKDAKLTFVRSEELLGLEANPDGTRRIAVGRESGERAGKARRILEALLRKGLILETRPGL